MFCRQLSMFSEVVLIRRKKRQKLPQCFSCRKTRSTSFAILLESVKLVVFPKLSMFDVCFCLADLKGLKF